MENGGEWFCIGCPKDRFGKASNFADRATCRKCGKPNPKGKPTATVTFKPGDWYCAKCNDHQFRDNKFCRKCNSSKPASDDAEGTECVVCFVNQKNTGFLHGKDVHVCCCKECATKLQSCPICRAPIEISVTVYF